MSNATRIQLSDYSLVGRDTARAIEQGLAEATWYTCPVDKEKMRELLKRRDWPAIRDTVLWFSLIFCSGWAGFVFWQQGSLWAIPAFLVYGTLYASTSDSRWHESSHGTAFKTDWLNDLLYEIASFMVMRESSVWRWSHTRHHSDTIIVGRDPEIAVPRPPDLLGLFMSFFSLKVIPKYFRQVTLHATGKISAEEKTFIPESEYGKVIIRARIYLVIYAGVAGLAVYEHSILPLMFIGLPTLYGSWLMPIYGYTQHAGLAENVLDHRLNCRTVYVNFIHRYLYWNMNYHVEHHMFPLVPYHNLPQLHRLVKSDMPAPYTSLWNAWREIVPAVLRQVKDPGYCVKRSLPTPTIRREAPATAHVFTAKGQPRNGWIEICASSFLKLEDVIRFDHEGKTYAIYRSAGGSLHATDGICTHGNTHLADGMVKGNLIECPKHNGRFDITDGSPQRQPVCVALKTYPAREHDEKIFLDLSAAGKSDRPSGTATHHFRVLRNDNVATFIKELVLAPEPGTDIPPYQPGDYLQLEIPAYGEISFREIEVKPPYSAVWQARHVHDFRSENRIPIRRNYSLATNPATDRELRFNVRIATPPQGQDCLAGAGSAYVHRLKPGDKVTAIGPFGSFHIKPGTAEMIYVGGGAGMAPLRSHISHLFETLKTTRRVSLWYGARSRQEIFYQDYFEGLAARFPQFTFHVALSEPLPEDGWAGPVGHIHDVLEQQYLAVHDNPTGVEYYLCGPPAMIRALTGMLAKFKVPDEQISFDEF